MSVYKNFIGNTVIYGISAVISRLFNFILTPIYVRVYPKAVYGIFTNVYANASIINAVLAFGMESAYFRYLNKHENQKREVYNNSFLVIAFLSTLFLISGLVLKNEIATYLSNKAEEIDDYKKYVSYFIWVLYIDAICIIPFAKLRADEKPKQYSIAKFLNIGSFVGFNLFFIFVIPYLIKHHAWGASWLASWYRQGWVGYVFISNLIASIATFLYLLPLLLQLQLRFNKQLGRSMLSYSWPVLVANLSFIVNENLDKIVLGKLLPGNIADGQVGIYGAVCKIAVFMSIFNTAFRLGAEPFFFSQAKYQNAKKIYAVILEYFVIAQAVIFVSMVANIEILKFFIGRDAAHRAEYWVGLPAVPYLLLGYVCLGIYMNLSIWYRLSDQTRFGVYISMTGALITIIFNFILIPHFSYMGSAWVSMLSYLVMMIVSYLLGRKYYPIPYNLKKILTYLIASSAIAFCSFFLFKKDIYIGNALLLIFVGIIFYTEKEQLQKILKEYKRSKSAKR